MLYIDNYENIINHYINNIATKYLNIPTVVGFGFSFKEIEGHSTSIPSLTFFVKEKISPPELNPQYLLPKTIESIITDTIETGDFYVNANCKKNDNINPFYDKLSNDELRIDKYRPAFGGLSCSNENAPIECEGCIGAAVTYSKPTERDALLFLGCNHVLTKDFKGMVKDTITQPAKIYRNSHRLASTHFISSITPRTTNIDTVPKSDEWNLFNFALGSVGYLDNLHQQVFLRPGLGLNKNDYIPINGTDTPKNGDNVWKIGPFPTLTKTKGKITASNVKLSSVNICGKVFAFENQALADIPFNRGDAGALLMKTTVIPKKNLAVGMCFATSSQGSKNFTVFTPINGILEKFRIKFIN